MNKFVVQEGFAQDVDGLGGADDGADEGRMLSKSEELRITPYDLEFIAAQRNKTRPRAVSAAKARKARHQGAGTLYKRWWALVIGTAVLQSLERRAGELEYNECGSGGSRSGRRRGSASSSSWKESWREEEGGVVLEGELEVGIATKNVVPSSRLVSFWKENWGRFRAWMMEELEGLRDQVRRTL